jgi:hypothetical protein
VCAVDAGTQKGITREPLDALGGEALDESKCVVVRGLEKLRIEVSKETDHVRIPRPPHIARQLFELELELLLRGHSYSSL